MVSQTHHNYTGVEKRIKPKSTPRKHRAQSVFTPHKETEKTFGSDCKVQPDLFCPSRIVWDAKSSPHCDHLTAARVQTGLGWGRRAAASVLFPLPSTRREDSRHRARGMDRSSLICVRLIWMVFHRDAFEKTGTRRLSELRLLCECVCVYVCCAGRSVPPSINASFQCARRAPSERFFPVPACPRLLCHCYFTSTAPRTLLFLCNPNSRRSWLVMCLMCRLRT